MCWQENGRFFETFVLRGSETQTEIENDDDESCSHFCVSCEFCLVIIITMYERNGLCENVDTVIDESVERRYVTKKHALFLDPKTSPNTIQETSKNPRSYQRTVFLL